MSDTTTTTTMHTRSVTVTPRIALSWLEKDKGVHHNRPLKQYKVEQYARDMKEGRWQPNHQGIAFGPDGEILDGQHRLWGLVEADVEMPFLVTFNMPPEAQMTVDDHMKRNVVDVMSVTTGGAGFVSLLHAAIANRMIHGNKQLEQPTRQQTIAYLTKHFEAIDFAIVSLGRRSVRGITRAPVLAPVARAWYSSDHARLSAFLDILKTGIYEKRDKDQAAMMLRDFLLRTYGRAGTTPSASLVYSKTERALFAFLNGDALAKLHEASAELFPVSTDSQKVVTLTERGTRRLRRVAAANREG